MEKISKNNSLETAKNRLDISGLTYLEGTKYVNDRIVETNIDDTYRRYIPIIESSNGYVLRYKNLMNQYYWLINKFIPSCEYEQLCIRNGEKKWIDFTDICELRGEVIFKYLDFNYKVLSVVTVLKGEKVTNNVTANLPGYTFNGWFTEREGGELFDFDTPINEDTEVFAQYTINTYTITFVYNDTDVETIVINYNEVPEPSHTPTKEGYTFIGWNKAIVPATKDTTYTARYRINKYVVNFYDITNPDVDLHEYYLLYSENVNYGNPVARIPSDPTYTHYNFINWIDDTGQTVDLTYITGDTDVFAEVEAKMYTVTFYNWDGTVLSAETVPFMGSATPPDVPGRDNYTFVGWDKDYTNIKNNTYIHAVYSADELLVNFILPFDDESDILYYSAYTGYNSVIIEPEKPSTREYDPYVFGLFDGWYANSAYTSQWDFSTLITEDTIIYGKWKEWFEVSFYNWDNTLITGTTEELINPVYVRYSSDVPSSLTHVIEEHVLPKQGYDFLGWNKSTEHIIYDVKITAMFSDVQMCEVAFVNGNDGSIITTMRVEYGGTILQSEYPTPPEIEKYNFSYWSGNTSGVYSNTIVTAIYEPVNMTVHYIDAVGDPILDSTVKYLSTGVTPTIAVPQITVNGIYPEEPYIYAVLDPTGEFCYVDNTEDLYVEPDEDCVNPEEMVITENNTKFVAVYNIIETGVTSCNVKFYSQDLVYFYTSRELYGTLVDSAYTANVLNIFAENHHEMDPEIYDFECWVDQDGNEYRIGENEYVITKDASLAAKYEMRKSKVVFHDILSNLDISAIETDSLVNNPVDRPNYLLIPNMEYYTKVITPSTNRWYKDAACTNEWLFRKDINGQTITNPDILGDEDITLYGRVYEGVSYNLIFATNGGSDIPPDVVQYPNVTVRPADPTKQGYNFAGWYTNNTYQEEFVFGEQLFENTVIYAKWEESPVVFRIIYNATTDLRHVPNLETMGDGVNIIREQCTYDSETGSGSLAYDNDITEIPGQKFYDLSALRSINIPNTVINIGASNFWSCINLSSVVLPNSLRSIGGYSFYNCQSLTVVQIPSSVASITSPVFSSCHNLTAINVDSSNSYYSSENGVLYDKNKTKLITYPAGKQGGFVIPNTVTSIEFWAFIRCYGLSSVTIGNSVTIIEQSAFNGCTGLTSVTIPDSVTNIEVYAFSGCLSLEEITCNATTPPTLGGSIFENVPTTCKLYVPCESVSLYEAAAQWQDLDVQHCIETILHLNDSTTVTLFGDTLLTNMTYPYRNTLVSCEVGDGVITLGSGLFFTCSELTSVTISDTVENIETQCFEQSHVNELIIPSSVTNIGNGAFRRNTYLQSITFESIVPPTIGLEVFSNTNDCPIYVPCEAVNDYKSATNWSTYESRIQCHQETGTILHLMDSSTVIIPDNVLTKELISDVYSGTVVACEIGDNVTSIGNDAFLNCHFLTSIEIPNNVTSIGRYAFNRCTHLQTVILPNNISTLPTGIFNDCSSLTSINIPDSVSSIGESAFLYCANISEITIGENVNEIGVHAFEYCTSISRVTCKASNPPTLRGNTFTPPITTLLVKHDCVEDYENSDWASYFIHIEGY